MSKFILIKEFDTMHSHFPDITGNYASLCGLDGQDSLVGQSIVGKSNIVNCPYCISIFDLVSTYTERDVSRSKEELHAPQICDICGSDGYDCTCDDWAYTEG